MSIYGRFGTFRQSPTPQHRLGRMKTGNAALEQLVPVVGAGPMSAGDARIVVGRPAANAAPIIGLSGILVHEEAWTAKHGQDPETFSSSDYDTVPANTQAQVVHGTEVKLLVQNLSADDLEFDGMRSYTGRNMFNPTDLETLAIGNMVTVGAGNPTDGFWKKTATAAEAWGTVVEVDAEYGLAVFQLRF